MPRNRKLCVFIHYRESQLVPLYVRIYLNELSRFFDQIIWVSNQSSSQNDVPPNVRLLSVTNEGYDFGMFYKAVQTVDLQEYHQIACINDSNILFNTLDPVMAWGKRQDLDFWGVIDSHQKPWFSTNAHNYHIQSHFLIFNKRALEKLPVFFQSLDLEMLFQQKDKKKLRQQIIDKWEIGLTQFFLKAGLSVDSFIKSRSFALQHHIKKPGNLSHTHYADLVEAGYPLIKKKIILESSPLRHLFRPEKNWDRLLLQYGHPDWKIAEMIDELKHLQKPQ